MLVYTPNYFSNESLFGYILRLSELNGYDTPSHVLSYAGYKPSEMRSTKFNCEKLSNVIGKHGDNISKIAYTSTDTLSKINLLGHDLGLSARGFINLKKPKICPLCITEIGYIEAFWDLSLAVVCPKHKIIPTHKCSYCEQKLRILRPGLVTCNCNQSLLANTNKNKKIDEAVIELVNILKFKLENKSLKDIENTSNFPKQILDQQSLSSFILIIYKLSQFSLMSKKLSSTDNHLKIVTEAASVLKNWPNNYHQLLDRIGTIYLSENSSKKTQSIGLRSQFKKFYVSMFLSKHQADYDPTFLKKEFIRFGANHWGNAVIDNKFLHFIEDTDNKQRFVNLSQASKDIGISPTTLRKLVKEDKINVKAKNTSSYVLDTQELNCLKEENKMVYTAREASKYSLFPVSVLNSLKSSGFFGPQGNTALNKASFKQEDLDWLLNQILNASPVIQCPPLNTKNYYSLHYVLHQLRFWSKQGKANFLESYLLGDIRPRGRTSDSMKEIYFDKKTVDYYVEKSRTNSSKNTLSVQHAAKKLGCIREVVYGLVEQQLIISYQGPNRIRVKSESIERFMQSYVFIKQIANELNTTAIYLLNFAKKHGFDVYIIQHRQITGFIKKGDKSLLLETFSNNKSILA